MSRCLENMKTPKYDIPLWHAQINTIPMCSYPICAGSANWKATS